jgi:hypothetical protein
MIEESPNTDKGRSCARLLFAIRMVTTWQLTKHAAKIRRAVEPGAGADGATKIASAAAQRDTLDRSVLLTARETEFTLERGR